MTTSQLDAQRVGAQEPRVCTRPAFVSSAGQEAIDLGESAGIFLDPWEQTVVHVTLAEAANGNWAALEVAILVARQNGKGEILLVLELGWLFLFGDRLIIHTAHEFKTAAEAFLRLKLVIDSNDWMSRRVKTERTSHGEEGYVMTNGQRLRFLARSRSSGRGFTGDKIILDEAQELPQLAMNALMPTLSARPNPQLVYTGTVPSSENDAKHWTKLMTRGRAGTSTRLAWLEWNIGEKLPEAALYTGDDPVLVAAREVAYLEALYAANPALGFRLSEEFCQLERESLSTLGYFRERLNLWSSDPIDLVIPLDVWRSLADAGSVMVGRRAVAVDCPPGLASATVAVMGRRADGRWHGEIIERERGTQWLPTRVGEVLRKNEDIAAVVVDPGSPAGALIPDIEAEGVEVTQVTTRQHAQGCGQLYARATATDEAGRSTPGLHHLGDPILEETLKVATKRPGPEGTWLWNRKDSGDDISPLVALTLAGYGLSTLVEAESEPWGFWS